MKNLPGEPLKKFNQVKDYLKENGFSGSQVSTFDKAVGDILSSKDTAAWVDKVADLMTKLKVPPEVIDKFKKVAPSKMPKDVDDIVKLLKEAGMPDALIEKCKSVFKWIQNVKYP